MAKFYHNLRTGESIKRVKSGAKYYFKHQSPTEYNLAYHLKTRGWVATSNMADSAFGTQNLLDACHFSQTLEFKHSLAQLLRFDDDLLPQSLLLNETNWPEQLSVLIRQERNLCADFATTIKWILKPALLNNGQGLRLFRRAEDVAIFLSQSNRLAGPYVLQHYLAPDLLRQYHKYSLRMFLVIAHLKAYLYQDGYYNICLHPYQAQAIDKLTAHLTNEHLSAEQSTVQIPSARFPDFKTRWAPLINTMITQVLSRYLANHALTGLTHQTLGLFGVDFMVDAQKKLWLLEFNHGPCFPVQANHSLQRELYQPFWQKLVSQFVVGNQPRYSFHQFKHLINLS